MLALVAGCEVPSDPDNTFNRVRVEGMRVGVIQSPPWACYGEEGASGIEAVLVNELAEQLDTDVTWTPGPEHELLPALQHFELDLVIGGITRSSPWKRDLAFSRPYYKSPIVVLGPPGSPALDSIKDLRVAVPPGTGIAAAVRAKGGIAVPASEPGAGQLPRALPGWRVNTLGRSGFELKELSHVFALPPGENRWVVEVEKFLFKRKDKIPALVYAAGETANTDCSGIRP